MIRHVAPRGKAAFPLMNSGFYPFALLSYVIRNALYSKTFPLMKRLFLIVAKVFQTILQIVVDLVQHQGVKCQLSAGHTEAAPKATQGFPGQSPSPKRERTRPAEGYALMHAAACMAPIQH